MSVFTDQEREYLQSGVLLGRLATVGADGTPHVVPTSFRYNEAHDTIDIGGHDFATRKKYRDVGRNPRVAFVVDEIVSVSPWCVGVSRYEARWRFWIPVARNWGPASRRRCSGSDPSAS